MSSFDYQTNNETTEINKISAEMDAEINKLLSKYDTSDSTIRGNDCPIFFSQLKNKFFTFSNKGKNILRQYLFNKITTQQQKLLEQQRLSPDNQIDPRIAKLQYFLEKLCLCTGTCKDTLEQKVFIKGGKRKSSKKYKKSRKTRKSRKTKRRK
jgi:hypothetical protein